MALSLWMNQNHQPKKGQSKHTDIMWNSQVMGICCSSLSAWQDRSDAQHAICDGGNGTKNHDLHAIKAACRLELYFSWEERRQMMNSYRDANRNGPWNGIDHRIHASKCNVLKDSLVQWNTWHICLSPRKVYLYVFVCVRNICNLWFLKYQYIWIQVLAGNSSLKHVDHNSQTQSVHKVAKEPAKMWWLQSGEAILKLFHCSIWTWCQLPTKFKQNSQRPSPKLHLIQPSPAPVAIPAVLPASTADEACQIHWAPKRDPDQAIQASTTQKCGFRVSGPLLLNQSYRKNDETFPDETFPWNDHVIFVVHSRNGAPVHTHLIP